MSESVWPSHVAILSLHTSPLDQPGQGDAGGLNVYVLAQARTLRARGHDVTIVTLADSAREPVHEVLPDGIHVRRLPIPASSAAASCAAETSAAGSARADTSGAQAHAGARPDKNGLASHVEEFAAMLGGGGEGDAPDGRAPWDVIHSHYWVSGLVGARVAKRRGIPHVHSPHTLGRVKAQAPGLAPEPPERLAGEQRLADSGAWYLANTPLEAAQLTQLYGVPAQRIRTAAPGVDTRVFYSKHEEHAHGASTHGHGVHEHRPQRGEGRQDADGEIAADGETAQLAAATDRISDFHIVFAGRVQPLKGPDFLLEVFAELRRLRPDIPARVSIVGQRSGAQALDLPALAERLGVADRVNLLAALSPERLAALFRSASTVVMPSLSESFGLVALEAQASGTPVIANRVGGLPYALGQGRGGVLINPAGERGGNKEPWQAGGAGAPADLQGPQAKAAWVRALARMYDGGARQLAADGRAAARHAAHFSWEHNVEETVRAYRDARAQHQPAHSTSRNEDG